MHRESDGRFARGNRGGPGRPRGFRGVSQKIMRLTHDGDALIAYAWAVLNDPSAPSRDRWTAHQWLSDRGLGKAATQEEPDEPEGWEEEGRPFASLSDDDLSTIELILSKSIGRHMVASSPLQKLIAG